MIRTILFSSLLFVLFFSACSEEESVTASASDNSSSSVATSGTTSSSSVAEACIEFPGALGGDLISVWSLDTDLPLSVFWTFTADSSRLDLAAVVGEEGSTPGGNGTYVIPEEGALEISMEFSEILLNMASKFGLALSNNMSGYYAVVEDTLLLQVPAEEANDSAACDVMRFYRGE